MRLFQKVMAKMVVFSLCGKLLLLSELSFYFYIQMCLRKGWVCILNPEVDALDIDILSLCPNGILSVIMLLID